MSYRIEFHCLHWPNVSKELVDLQRRCFEHIGVKVNYTEKAIDHALWMDQVLRTRLPQLDAVGFIDIDCIAYSTEAISKAIAYVEATGSFLGLGQASGPHPMQIYAAPAFLVLSRRAYEMLGRPSMRQGIEWDVAQRLSMTADKVGFHYRVLYPIGFYLPNSGRPWRLGSYGRYGQGTEYRGGFFHNFNSRTNDALEIFKERAQAVLADEGQPTVMPNMSEAFTFEEELSSPTHWTILLRTRLGYRHLRNILSPHVPHWARRLRNWVYGK